MAIEQDKTAAGMGLGIGTGQGGDLVPAIQVLIPAAGHLFRLTEVDRLKAGVDKPGDAVIEIHLRLQLADEGPRGTLVPIVRGAPALPGLVTELEILREQHILPAEVALLHRQAEGLEHVSRDGLVVHRVAVDDLEHAALKDDLGIRLVDTGGQTGVGGVLLLHPLERLVAFPGEVGRTANVLGADVGHQADALVDIHLTVAQRLIGDRASSIPAKGHFIHRAVKIKGGVFFLNHIDITSSPHKYTS